MPITVPAHQSFVLPLKIKYPHLFDGTALFVGAASPDLAYAFGSWSHTVKGVVIWALPFTLVACMILRRGAARCLGAQCPDLGLFRLRSFGVLASRSPKPIITFTSALIGSVSHLFVDAFTHANRWGAQWLGTNDVLVDLPIFGARSLTRIFQYVGHILGSATAIALLLYIGGSRMLERWYSSSEVISARSVSVNMGQRIAFWGLVGGIATASVILGIANGRNWVFSLITGAAIGLLAASALGSRVAVTNSNPV